MAEDITLDINISYMDIAVLKYIKTLYCYEDYSSVVVALLDKYYNSLPRCEKELIRLKAEKLEFKYGTSNAKN